MEEQLLRCPLCRGTSISDISRYQSNNILGSGAASWKILDLRCCDNCGVVFQPKENKILVKDCNENPIYSPTVPNPNYPWIPYCASSTGEIK